jgi:cysteine desulfurase
MKPVYLDYNATTPIDPRVAEAMRPFIERDFGNPSSAHAYGTAAKRAVEKARRQVASLLGCEVYEVVFTSGGSESNNHAILGVARASRGKGNHIITSSIEHPAVVEVCRFLEANGFAVTYLPVDEFGLVDPRDVERAVTPQTILITIMHANNEVGTIEPVAEIAAMARSSGILVHSDCAQSLGKIPVGVPELGVDLLSVAGHKIYAPKGVGALYVRDGVNPEKLIHGADQERKRRAGTENVIGIVGLGEACAIISEGLESHARHMRAMRDRLEEGLKAEFGDVRINGHPGKRLPNTTSMGFRGLEANTILSELTGVAASAGAACHSDRVDISSVLEAMGDHALEEVKAVVGRLSPRGITVGVNAGADKVKLTRYTHGLGCACKLRPQVLEKVLARMPRPLDANVLVGTETADDAAVYRIDEKTAIVQTVDFFTPVVDDPFQFGAIAAANSLSDIYAMGARPLFALSVVGFPSNRLPLTVLEDILDGARRKADEAGISIIGGHTVDDIEPKFGLAVSGVVDPSRIITNRNAKAGDVLVLTKPLGTGILSTALKQGLLEPEGTRLLMDVMATLNRAAAEAMLIVGANACTDVTGFGFLGHLLEMMRGSGTSAVIEVERVRFLRGAAEHAAAGIAPGGSISNSEYTAPFVGYSERVSDLKRLLLNDAQTSGGLLVSVAEEHSEEMMALLRDRGVEEATMVGRVIPEGKFRIMVEP